MQLKTILNFVEPYKSFVYTKARWADSETKTEIEILIEPRANGRAICSGCGKRAFGYDRLAERRFEFVPLWQIAVYFVYAMRRVDCRRCGVRVERVPWCDGKNHLTTTYRWFLSGWAKRLCWKGVAEAFGTTWQNVFRSVKHAVLWGVAHRELEGIEAIGVDEVQWQRGHKYLTLVYQIDAGSKRLLWIGKDRTTKTFLRFFRMLGKDRSGKLKFVCSDMWKPYLKVIAKKAAGANGTVELRGRADRPMTGCGDFVRFAPPGLVSTCFAILGNKMAPSLVPLAHRDQGGFLHVQSSRCVTCWP